jgi:hypothetical protein
VEKAPLPDQEEVAETAFLRRQQSLPAVFTLTNVTYSAPDFPGLPAAAVKALERPVIHNTPDALTIGGV